MQKTKRNWVLRLVGIVLIFTLVSTSLLGGTLARYVTSGEGIHTARVARWGVEVTAQSDEDSLFSTQYTQEGSTELDSTHAPAATGLSVLSSSEKNVIAPGTEGEISSFSITGQPEVACNVKFQVNEDESGFSGNWEIDTTGEEETAYEGNYYPIQWSIQKGDGEIKTFDELSELITEINKISYNFAPGKDLSDLELDYTISWQWAIEDGVTDQTDARDTALGNNFADTGNEDDEPTVTLAFDIIVTQID